MSEMVERVARVLCARNGEPESCLKFYRDDARAAIEAMREPTPDMVSAGEGYHYADNTWEAMIAEALK